MKVSYGYSFPQEQAEAAYQVGRCFEALGDKNEAYRQYNAFIQKYPQTEMDPLGQASDRANAEIAYSERRPQYYRAACAASRTVFFCFLDWPYRNLPFSLRLFRSTNRQWRWTIAGSNAISRPNLLAGVSQTPYRVHHVCIVKFAAKAAIFHAQKVVFSGTEYPTLKKLICCGRCSDGSDTARRRKLRELYF